MKKFLASLLLFFVVLAPTTLAQESIVISPQSIVVNPLPKFDVEVSVDKDPSGNSTPSYNVGENITVNVRVSEDAYVYLFSVHSDGVIDQIIPNKHYSAGQDNFIRAGQTKSFLPANAGFQLSVQRPTGLDKVIAVASKKPLDTNRLASFESGAGFASSKQGEESFARSLSIVVTPISQDDWVTDTALFYVVDNAPPPRSPYGTISVTGSPGKALVYIDGQFRGFTPISFGERVGSHALRIELGGYQVFERTINVRSGQTITIDTNLTRINPTGTVTFRSNPSGADVYIGGSRVGTTPTGPISYNAGSYQVSFRLGGYGEITQSFNVSANSNQTVDISMVPLQGMLLIRNNVPGARIFVNGQDYGSIPGGTGRINDLPSGRHQLTIVASGYSTFITDFTVNPGQTTEIQASQSRR